MTKENLGEVPPEGGVVDFSQSDVGKVESFVRQRKWQE